MIAENISVGHRLPSKMPEALIIVGFPRMVSKVQRMNIDTKAVQEQKTRSRGQFQSQLDPSKPRRQFLKMMRNGGKIETAWAKKKVF